MIEPILGRIDVKKRAAADFDMFAQGHRNDPGELVGVGREADAVSEIQQKESIRFGLFPRCDIACRDVDSE